MQAAIIRVEADRIAASGRRLPDLLRRAAHGSAAPDRVSRWFGEQLIELFATVRQAVQGSGPGSAAHRNALVRAGLQSRIAPSRWPGLPVTQFMAGAYLAHIGASDLFPLENRDTILAWFFLDFAAQRDNDRFVTAEQRRALKSPSPFEARSSVAAAIARSQREPGAGPQPRDAAPGGTERDPDLPAYLEAGRPALSVARPDPADHPEVAIGTLRLGDCVWFGENGQSDEFVVPDTWHGVEAEQRWTRGDFGLMSIPLSAEADGRELMLDADLMMPYLGDRPGRLGIVFNGSLASESRTLPPGNQRILVPLPRTTRLGRRANMLSFHAIEFRPSDFGAHDPRTLGVAVKRLWIRDRV